MLILGTEQFNLLLKAFFFGSWYRGALWLTVNLRLRLLSYFTYLLTYLLTYYTSRSRRVRLHQRPCNIFPATIYILTASTHSIVRRWRWRPASEPRLRSSQSESVTSITTRRLIGRFTLILGFRCPDFALSRPPTLATQVCLQCTITRAAAAWIIGQSRLEVVNERHWTLAGSVISGSDKISAAAINEL